MDPKANIGEQKRLAGIIALSDAIPRSEPEGGVRKMAERWWIAVCPECNGRVDDHSQVHDRTCPNRTERLFAARVVEVVPAAMGTGEEMATAALELADLVLALDEWRAAGGFDPYAKEEN